MTDDKESAAAQATEAESRGSLETSLPPGPASAAPLSQNAATQAHQDGSEHPDRAPAAAAPCAWKGLCPHAEACDRAGTCLRAMQLDPDPTHWSREDRGDGYGDTSGGMPLKTGE